MRTITTNDLLDQPAGIGHNNPPPIEIARERVERLVAAADKWASLKELDDEEQSRRCSDALDQIDQEIKKIDAERRAEKKPHDDAAAAVQEKWRPLDGRLNICKAALKGLLAGFLRREQARLDEERRRQAAAAAEARRAADEARRKAEADTKAGAVSRQADIAEAQELQRRADEAAALAAEPRRANARGDLGGRARSLRTVWRARIDDPTKAVRFYRGHSDVLAVVAKLANADARTSSGQCQIPGCTVYSIQE